MAENNPPPPRVRKAIGPRLRPVLIVVFVMTAVLAANSIYLATVSAYNWWTGLTHENWFYQYMFLAHLGLGLVLVLPFLVFSLAHMRNTYRRRNRMAVRVGYALFAVSLALLVSGLLLTRGLGLDMKSPAARSFTYWLHALSPLVVVWLYWLHRLAGRKIHYRAGIAYLAVAAASTLLLVGMHSADPRKWNEVGPAEGEKYFSPSLVRTSTGKFIPADTLMMDEYCKQCHADIYNNWFHSAHRFSSFNNPAYLASVRETRKVLLERDGNVQASRWCAGCHDPVPFFSGAFDDPEYDDVNHPTSQAGITCTVCHAITHVNSVRGNADFTVEEPLHYPFAASDNPLLQAVNRQLVKAKPEFHKKTFLKPLHKTAEFCSTCHKVHLPYELNHYKEFLRGQNHYDSFLLSGVSGGNARSFYYPPVAEQNCNKCHMPRVASDDFGARPDPKTGELSVHNHLFPAANTALPWLREEPEIVQAQQEFLKDCVRVDLFGVRKNGEIDGELMAPLRPEIPVLVPGETYLLETVIRTLKLGHLFTQGTTDSNELWLEMTVRSGDNLVAISGAVQPDGTVDPESHFVNTFMLDRHGNRINRRNAQDIFVPLYSRQIPPGAAQSVHYRLQVPEDATTPLTVSVRFLYRKFDQEYMEIVAANARRDGNPLRGDDGSSPYRNELPITVMAEDTVTFPVAGGGDVPPQEREIPAWQRWNDYGIGALLKGKAELRQAEDAFRNVEELDRYDGPLNLARVYFAEGRLEEAVAAVRRAAEYTDPAAPPWTVKWLSGVIAREQGLLSEAAENLKSVLYDRTPEMISRGFDFAADYLVRNQYGQVLFDQARQIRGDDRAAERNQVLQAAVEEFHKALDYDPENVTAHYNLSLLYGLLDDDESAEKHRQLHARFKPDDNAAGQARRIAREKYPAADKAAEAVIIYDLPPATIETKAAAGSIPGSSTTGS